MTARITLQSMLALLLLASCACGEEAGQKCCDGNVCELPMELACDPQTQTCVDCGEPGGPCCSAWSYGRGPCDSQLVCSDSGICEPCGELGQPCCGTQCTVEFARCSDDHQCYLPVDGALVPSASKLCEQAAPPIETSTPPQPALIYTIKNQDGRDGWAPVKWNTFPHQPKVEADVQTVVCIEEQLVRAFNYNDGTGAFRTNWSVWIISYPEGALLAQESLTGPTPGSMTIQTGKDVIGKRPSDALKEWLDVLMGPE